MTEAVKEYIVRLVMQKEAEQKAQRRTAVRAAGRVEHSAGLALLRADPGGASTFIGLGGSTLRHLLA
jgi:hypothetical protein